MKKEPNKKAIGLFLVIGFALLLVIVGQTVWRKMYNDEKDIFVMYFDESLSGLSEGSPVVLHGVEVGQVVRIRLMADSENLSFQAPVYVRIKPVKEMKEKTFWPHFSRDRNLLKTLIDKGLRARLATQSFLTGQLMIELVIVPDSPIHEKTELTESKFPQIPTILSKGEELAKGLDNLQIQKMVNNLNLIIEELSKQLPILMPALSNSAQNLDNTLSKVSKASDETIYNLNKTLSNVSDAAQSIQNLADYLERHPESLIKGKKGE